MDLSRSGVGAWLLRTRAVVRAPIALYRVGLGGLLGSRILLLEHRGRRSGERRYVCLEVVDHSAPDRYVIVSGFGERADWYRNLRADPRCFVSTGWSRRVPATSRFLNDDESATVLEHYRTEHPGTWQTLQEAIEKAVDHPVDGLPMVELHLSRQ